MSSSRHTLLLLFAVLSSEYCRAQYPEVNYRLPEPSTRDYLFGDWNGWRTDLADRGVVFNIESTNDNMWVLHGGASNQGTAWERIRGTLDIDFGKLKGWKGVKFHATALWQTGNNVGAKLNSLANPSSIDSVHVFRMDSYWIEDSFAHDRVTVRLGQMAGWDYYGNQEYGADYLIEPLGYAFGNIFDNVYLTYNPAGVPAAQFLCDGTKRTENGRAGFYAETGVYSSNRDPYVQDPTGMEFKIRNSPVVAAEAGYTFQSTRHPDRPLPPDRKLYPGIYRFGGIYNPGTFYNQLTQVPSKGNHLIYFLMSQAVYRSAPGSNRGLDVSFGLDYSPNDVSRQNSMITSGAIYHGLVPHRPADDVSFGFVSTRIGSAYSDYSELMFGIPLRSEHAYTLDYRIQVSPWLVIQPTTQYFTAIGGDPRRSSGVVIGFRTYLRL